MYLFFKGLCAIIIIGTLTGSGCSNAPERDKLFIFLGHPYDWQAAGNRIDPRLEKLDLEKFDEVWLGGDVCSKTSASESTLRYLDSIFDFKSGKTHWAIGNHDVLDGNAELITKWTGRPLFYVEHSDGITVVVLNTLLFYYPQGNPSATDCKLIEEQFEMLRQLADTLANSSHLIVLHHHCLLTNSLSEHAFAMDTIFNLYLPEQQVSCKYKGTFQDKIYPLLNQIQQKGIQVIMIGGDFGMRQKSFQHRTSDGIWFLGSGINNSVSPEFAPEYVTNFDPDKILTLHYQPAYQQLTWKFLDLDSLVMN